MVMLTWHGVARAGLSASDPVVMRSFYQRLFPWRDLFQWLNHGPTPGKDFAYREFAFTLQNNAYQRYQSFATSDLYVLASVSPEAGFKL
jgi:DNA primase small subunit